MSRKAVRLAIQTYLQNYGLTYVGTVYPARPIIVTEDAYYQTMQGQAIQASQAGSAAVLVINFSQDDRTREADAGRGAVQDKVVHQTVIEVWFASPVPTPVNVTQQITDPAVQAQLDYDDVIESIFVAIRRNATPGGGKIVWSFGEFTAGISHQQLLPITAAQGMAITIHGIITVEAWEWIAGIGV